jgi:uncharacterized peroxidase-related enzyme
MSRISIPSRAAAPAASQPILDAIEKKMGRVPNIFLLASLSPPALTGMTAMTGALSKALDVKTRERIAIATAQVNGCDYCLAAHSYLGSRMANMSADEIARNRQGGSEDPRADAAVHFAVRVAQTRGKVTDAELAAVRAAGFSDAEIVEIVSVVGDNAYHNMLNNVAETAVDFPAIDPPAE